MLNNTDLLRARFAPNDVVRFQYRARIQEGIVLRANPKRAVVLVDDQQYTVPYDLLIPEEGVVIERERRIKWVLNTARELMVKHGLTAWRFRLDHSTRRAGCCNFNNRTLSLAFDLAHAGTDADIIDTILHEIAHALVGKNHNHDAAWRAKAREIGCSGERTHTLQFSPPRWSVTCENRCWTHTAHQRNSKFICRTCGGRLIYTPYGV